MNYPDTLHTFLSEADSKFSFFKKAAQKPMEIPASNVAYR